MEHWNTYWHQTHSLHSFAEDDSSLGYSGAILAYWHEAFVSFNTGAHILDLATGNGALAVSLLEFSQIKNLKLKIYATDLAEIQPLRAMASHADMLALLRQIRFFAATASEQLPFAANSLDGVISQFGFEYADQQRAVAEIIRVLKPSASCQAMIHHRSSVLTKDCQSGLAFYDRLADAQFFELAIELLTVVEKAPVTQADKQQQKYLNKKLFELAKDLHTVCNNTAEAYWCQDFLQRVSPLFMQTMPGNLQLLNAFRQDILSHQARLRDQLASAWTEQDAEAFKACVVGHKVDLDPFFLQNELFGWSFKLTKMHSKSINCN